MVPWSALLGPVHPALLQGITHKFPAIAGGNVVMLVGNLGVGLASLYRCAHLRILVNGMLHTALKLLAAVQGQHTLIHRLFGFGGFRVGVFRCCILSYCSILCVKV